MSQNILILIGSPKGQKSTSNTISNYLEKELQTAHVNFTKYFLLKEMRSPEHLMTHLIAADTILLIYPVYENSVPSTVLQFFQEALKNKEHLSPKGKKFFAISLAGFCDVNAPKSSLTTCKLFAQTMSFDDLGSIGITPSTLIEGEGLGKIYANLSSSLKLLANSLAQNQLLPQEIYNLNEKALLPAPLYRVLGNIVQRKPAKTLGKDVFYAKPLA